jgi:hypothetical protein
MVCPVSQAEVEPDPVRALRARVRDLLGVVRLAYHVRHRHDAPLTELQTLLALGKALSSAAAFEDAHKAARQVIGAAAALGP